LRVIYDWGPSDEAESNPPIVEGTERGPLSISISASASAVQGKQHSHVLTGLVEDLRGAWGRID